MAFLTAFKAEMKKDLDEKFKSLETKVQSQFEKVRGELKEVKEQQDQLTASVSFISGQYDDIAPKVTEALATTNATAKSVAAVEAQSHSTASRMDKLEALVNTQAQAELCNNLVITGLAKTTDPAVTFWKLVAATKAKIAKSDVHTVDLLKKYEAKSTDTTAAKGSFVASTLLVRFASNAAKGELVAAKKRMGAAFNVQVADLTAPKRSSQNDKPRAIFYRDHLTEYTKKLFEQARHTKNALDFKFLWTKNGRIMMRKGEDTPPFRISSNDDLDKLSSNTNK